MCRCRIPRRTWSRRTRAAHHPQLQQHPILSSSFASRGSARQDRVGSVRIFLPTGVRVSVSHYFLSGAHVLQPSPRCCSSLPVAETCLCAGRLGQTPPWRAGCWFRLPPGAGLGAWAPSWAQLGLGARRSCLVQPSSLSANLSPAPAIPHLARAAKPHGIRPPRLGAQELRGCPVSSPMEGLDAKLHPLDVETQTRANSHTKPLKPCAVDVAGRRWADHAPRPGVTLLQTKPEKRV